MDKFGFKILNIIISCIEITVSWTIYFSAQSDALFIIENLLVACSLSGTFTTITPLFNKVFGKELATEIYGLTGFFIGVASFVGPLLTKIMINEDEDYLMVYMIGGGICLMKFMALLCFKEDEPYIFKYKDENRNKIDNKEIMKIEELGDDKKGDNEELIHTINSSEKQQ
jgi:MFS-type transporter involved in bile tolerance (Atg22 family)